MEKYQSGIHDLSVTLNVKWHSRRYCQSETELIVSIYFSDFYEVQYVLFFIASMSELLIIIW